MSDSQDTTIDEIIEQLQFAKEKWGGKTPVTIHAEGYGYCKLGLDVVRVKPQRAGEGYIESSNENENTLVVLHVF